MNCFGYVILILFGKEISREDMCEVYPRTYSPENPDPCKAVCKKLDSLGFDCRILSDANDILASDEKLIAFWGFSIQPDRIADDLLAYVYDFHFAVFKNGTWWNKPNWIDTPSSIGLNNLLHLHGYDPIFLAIKERTL